MIQDQTSNDRIRVQYEAYMRLRPVQQDPEGYDYTPLELKKKRHSKDKRGKRHV